ncbi:hypothetical protein FVE85_5492 [Porphyridium purpureum]|uniref:Telomere length regulation protein TEL2-like n=1 Tax=Porphyridium purpureum TaxID=35688 RepID=A0A5J4Z5J6_PORPP|nr:hypothetical protein FVE85_5492 [Porphyridium purpureum]|eukprot:POR6384..scf295_1
MDVTLDPDSSTFVYQIKEYVARVQADVIFRRGSILDSAERTEQNVNWQGDVPGLRAMPYASLATYAVLELCTADVDKSHQYAAVDVLRQWLTCGTALDMERDGLFYTLLMDLVQLRLPPALQSKVVSALVAAPERIQNVVGGALDPESPFGESRYLRPLVAATGKLLVQHDQEPQIGALGDELVQRLCARGYEEVILQSSSENRVIQRFMATVPPQYAGRMIRTILQHCSMPDQQQLLPELLNSSEQALQMALTQSISLSACVTDLDSLVRAMSWSSSNLVCALVHTSLHWSQPSFIRSLGLEKRRMHCALFVLLLNGTISKEHVHDEHSTTEILENTLAGVNAHLTAACSKTRLMGMMVAERFSSWWSSEHKVQFELPESPTGPEIELIQLVRGPAFAAATLSSDRGTISVQKASRKAPPERSERLLQPSVDDDELEPYDISDDEFVESSDHGQTPQDLPFSADAVKLARRIQAPHSLPRLLRVLREYATGKDDLQLQPELLAQVLKNVTQACRDPVGHPGIYEYCGDFARLIMSFETCRFAPSTESSMIRIRRSCLSALAELHPLNVGLILIEDFVFGTSTVLSLRSEALSIVVGAAKVISTEGDVNAFASIAYPLFQSLWTGMQTAPRRCPMIDLDRTDAGLLGHMIASLASITSLAGHASPQLARMCGQLAQLCAHQRQHEDAAVRRAVFLALGTVAVALPNAVVEDTLQDLSLTLGIYDEFNSGFSIFEWLEQVAERDSDEFVRRFAASCALKWADRMQLLAS